MTGYILPNLDNMVRGYERPPQILHYFTLDAGINRPILGRAHQEQGLIAATGIHHYFLHGYIGNLRYSFEFIIDQTRYNRIRALVIHGRLNLCI